MNTLDTTQGQFHPPSPESHPLSGVCRLGVVKEVRGVELQQPHMKIKSTSVEQLKEVASQLKEVREKFDKITSTFDSLSEEVQEEFDNDPDDDLASELANIKNEITDCVDEFDYNLGELSKLTQRAIDAVGRVTSES